MGARPEGQFSPFRALPIAPEASYQWVAWDGSRDLRIFGAGAWLQVREYEPRGRLNLVKPGCGLPEKMLSHGSYTTPLPTTSMAVRQLTMADLAAGPSWPGELSWARTKRGSATLPWHTRTTRQTSERRGSGRLSIPEIKQAQSGLYPGYVSSCVRSSVRLKGERSVGHGWWSDPGGTYLGAASAQHPLRSRSPVLAPGLHHEAVDLQPARHLLRACGLQDPATAWPDQAPELKAGRRPPG